MQIDIPYEDDSSLFSYPQCRQHLYTILKALMVCPNPQATPALNCAIRIFAIGRKDLSPQVAQICLEAGAICTQISRPRVRCWDHPGSDSLENHQFLFRDEEITHETEEMEQPITVSNHFV